VNFIINIALVFALNAVLVRHSWIWIMVYL